MNSQSLARGLAGLSVGLGLAEILAPRTVARAIGVDEDHRNLLRLFGLREIGTGLGILQGSPAGFVWSRVAGDAIDLSLLGLALRSPSSRRERVTGAIAAVAGITVLDVIGGMLLSRNPAEPEWRVARDDRRGMQFEEPAAMRQRAEDAMSAHQSGHLRNGAHPAHRSPGGMPAREEAASEEFEDGD